MTEHLLIIMLTITRLYNQKLTTTNVLHNRHPLQVTRNNKKIKHFKLTLHQYGKMEGPNRLNHQLFQNRSINCNNSYLMLLKDQL